MEKSVYEYISYRKYLADFYSLKKEQGTKFSYRSFASEVGVKFTNFLPALIAGDINLTAKNLAGTVRALELTEEESHYFELLVKFDQAEMQDEREVLFGQIASIRAGRQVTHIEEKRFAFYSNWAAVAIRELLNIIEYTPSDEEGYYRLGSLLRPRVSRKDARAAVMLLMDLGLVKEDERGVLRLTSQQITTGDEAPGFHIREYYRQMHIRATESMDIFPSDQRELSGISLSMSESALAKVKESIREFRRTVEQIVHEDSGNPEKLMQLNVAFFPMAEVPHEK